MALSRLNNCLGSCRYNRVLAEAGNPGFLVREGPGPDLALHGVAIQQIVTGHTVNICSNARVGQSQGQGGGVLDPAQREAGAG